jgi:hypothetical protein
MTIQFPSYTLRREAKWQEIQYREIPFSEIRLSNYSDALGSIYLNGRSDFAAFEAVNRDDLFSAYQCDHCGSRIPVEGLLSQAALFPQFSGGGLPYGSPKDVEITHMGGCQFEGLLADVLLGGGAYEGWKGSVVDARKLASEAVAAIRSIAPDRPWSPILVRGPWCSYFCDIAWDYTFVVQFPYDARWFVFAARDTD